MTVDFEDQSVLLRKIEQHALREQNLSSLPSLEQTSDNEGSDDEEEKAQFEALRRRNREAREREEQGKENRGDLENDVSPQRHCPSDSRLIPANISQDLETPAPARVSKQPIYSRAQRSQGSTTPPFQPTNRILNAVRSPSASTASSDQLPSVPNESDSSSHGIPVSSTPAPSRTDLRVSHTASTIKPNDRPTPEPSHKRFAKTLHHRDDIQGGRISVGSSTNGSFSIATIRHGEAELGEADEQDPESQIDNSLDLPRLSGQDLPQGVEYHDYAVPIKAGDDSQSFDERTAQRIRNPARQSSGLRNRNMEAPRIPDDRYDTSLDDQVNLEHSHGSERGESERGRNVSDITDAEEANRSAEDVVDIVIQMPDETVGSVRLLRHRPAPPYSLFHQNGSPAPNWVDTRARYRSQSPHIHRSALPRSPHPRALRASVNEYNESKSVMFEESDRSGSSEVVGYTDVNVYGGAGQDLATSAAVEMDRFALNVPEEDEHPVRQDDNATPGKRPYSPYHSTLSTPGVGRNASLAETPLQATQPPSFDTMVRERSLRDITHSVRNRRYDSPTPSEYYLGNSRVGSLQTPKPGEKTPADFLLSRLESTSKPLRYKAIRGRMSAAGLEDLTRNNRADMSLFGRSVAQIPGGLREEEFDVREISDVSLSSSLDLTTDKRMSTARRGRGNMSVPEINFSEGANEDGVNPSNLVKEMRLINIGLQQEYEIVNQEKEDLLQWCKSQGYQVPGRFAGDNQTATAKNLNSPRTPTAPHDSTLQRLRQAEEDCQQKEAELSQLRTKVENQADLEAQLQSLEKDVQTRAEAGKRDEIQITELRSQLQQQDQAAHREKAEWEADFRELEETIRVLKEEKERLAHDLAAADINQGDIQLQDELDDLRKDLQNSKEQLEEYEDTIRGLEAKLQVALDENARFVGDAFQAEDAAKSAIVARDGLQSDLDHHRTENEALHEQVRTLGDVNAGLRASLQERERQCEEAVEDRQRASEQIDRLSKDMDNLLSEKQMMQKDVDQLRESAEATAEDLQYSEERYLQEARRASDLQGQLDLLTKALKAAQGEVATLKKEASKDEDVSVREGATKRLTTELDRAESTIVHLRKRLEACEEQLEIAQHKSGAQARQMATIRQKDIKIETLTTEKAALVQQVQMLIEQQSNLSIAKSPKTPVQSVKGLASGTPFSALRPINRVLMNLRTPRTPGQLSDVG